MTKEQYDAMSDAQKLQWGLSKVREAARIGEETHKFIADQVSEGEDGHAIATLAVVILADAYKKVDRSKWDESVKVMQQIYNLQEE